VASSRSNSLHISVISEQEQEQEQEDRAGRREEDSDWLQDQFEGMTYEEIAVWVDTRARIAFPLLYLIFNCFYWVLVVDDELYQHFTSL